MSEIIKSKQLEPKFKFLTAPESLSTISSKAKCHVIEAISQQTFVLSLCSLFNFSKLFIVSL